MWEKPREKRKIKCKKGNINTKIKKDKNKERKNSKVIFKTEQASNQWIYIYIYVLVFEIESLTGKVRVDK